MVFNLRFNLLNILFILSFRCLFVVFFSILNRGLIYLEGSDNNVNNCNLSKYFISEFRNIHDGSIFRQEDKILFSEKLRPL